MRITDSMAIRSLDEYSEHTYIMYTVHEDLLWWVDVFKSDVEPERFSEDGKLTRGGASWIVTTQRS